MGGHKLSGQEILVAIRESQSPTVHRPGQSGVFESRRFKSPNKGEEELLKRIKESFGQPLSGVPKNVSKFREDFRFEKTDAPNEGKGKIAPCLQFGFNCYQDRVKIEPHKVPTLS